MKEIDTSPKNRESVAVEQFELEDQKGIIEALIFASMETLSLTRLAGISGLTRASVERIIGELNEEYIGGRRSFRIENVAGGYRMFTLPEYHSYINRANTVERSQKLSQAALEALAVIAYKQPITRAEIERIRGVDCGGVLKNLVSKNLVIIDGRSPAPGKPILYCTSEYFLEFFGLPSLDHLPPLTEFESFSESMPKLKLIRPDEDESNGEDFARLEVNEVPGAHDSPEAQNANQEPEAEEVSVDAQERPQ